MPRTWTGLTLPPLDPAPPPPTPHRSTGDCGDEPPSSMEDAADECTAEGHSEGHSEGRGLCGMSENAPDEARRCAYMEMCASSSGTEERISREGLVCLGTWVRVAGCGLRV